MVFCVKFIGCGLVDEPVGHSAEVTRIENCDSNAQMQNSQIKSRVLHLSFNGNRKRVNESISIELKLP